MLESDLRDYCSAFGCKGEAEGDVFDVHDQFAAVLHLVDDFDEVCTDGGGSWDAERVGQHCGAVLYLRVFAVLQHGVQCFDLQ